MADEKKGPRTRGSKKVKVESLDSLPKLRPRQRRLEISGKDPAYKYRLVRDNPEDRAYREELGYELDKEVSTRSGKGQPDQVRRVAGRYVVMRRPKELHEQHVKLLQQKAQRAIHGPREAFKNKARKHGFETEDSTRFGRGPMAAAISEDAEG